MNETHHSHHAQHSQCSHLSNQPHYRNSSDGHPSATGGKETGFKTQASPDEVARKAYEIYLKEGCPQGRDVQHWLAAETQLAV